MPGAIQSITWKDEYDKAVGGSNFNLLALHILKSTPYIVAKPNLCLSYNKWGRPNSPYVIFKHDGSQWQRIPLSELPVEFKEINLAVVFTKADEKVITSQSPMSVELVKKFNAGLASPESKTILREPLPIAQINQMCEERVLYKGSWILPDDPIARKMIDQRTK